VGWCVIESCFGDVRDRLADFPSAAIDCAITSPPYFQLRDYGVRGQLGLEPSAAVWVDEMRLALKGLARVLKPTGSLWLNLGDTYSRHAKYGAARKSLLLTPERLLLALADDGWIVRNKCIWFKTNPMPHSVADRLTNSYDVVYLLTRSQSYFFDLDAIRLPHRSSTTARRGGAYAPERASAPIWRQHGGGNRGLAAQKARGEAGHELGKNPGDVWQIASASFHGAHFATFPPPWSSGHSSPPVRSWSATTAEHRSGGRAESAVVRNTVAGDHSAANPG